MPLVQQLVRVDLRILVTEVPPQDVISRDNVSVKVTAVVYFRVMDAERGVKVSSVEIKRIISRRCSTLQANEARPSSFPFPSTCCRPGASRWVRRLPRRPEQALPI
jgi:hypothetical protein